MKKLILDNIENNNKLYDIIQTVIPLFNNNDFLINISEKLENNNISLLNNKLRKKLDNINFDEELDNIQKIFKFIDEYFGIYIILYNINDEFDNLIDIIDINYDTHGLDLYIKNKLLNNINYIKKEYEFYKNNIILQHLESYFKKIIRKYINNKDIFNYVSDILEINREIINLYIILFTVGLEYNKDNTDLYKYIIDINEINKDKVLDIVYKKYNNKNNIVIKNNVQDFEIISKYLYKKDEILSLQDIIYKVTNINNINLLINNKKSIINELDFIIKNYSNYKKSNISILIYNVNNKVDYVINTLLSKQKNIINKNYGINVDIIKLFDIIKVQENTKFLHNNIDIINYNEDNDFSIVLQTTNYEDFKLLYNNEEFLIPNNIIRNIIRNEPSKRIIIYNKNLENNILKFKNVDYKTQYQFNKYLDFNTISEKSDEIYKNLRDTIYNNIISKIKNLPGDLTDEGLFNIINTKDDIYVLFDNNMNDFYNSIIENIENLDYDISDDIYLSYISICDLISFKFRKNINDKFIYYNTKSNITNNEKIELIIKESIYSVINQRTDLYNFIIEKYNIISNYKY